jgi:oxazoline/thiazoline dehydrogenase
MTGPDGAVPGSLRASLVAGSSLRLTERGEWALHAGGRRVVLPRIAPTALAAVRGALQRPSCSGGSEDGLSDVPDARENPGDDDPLRTVLELLWEGGLLAYSAQENGRRLATLRAMAAPGALVRLPEDPTRAYVLSRFAYLRQDGGEMTLECPLSCVRMTVHDVRAMGLIHVLARPHTFATLRACAPHLSADATHAVLTLLVNGGFVHAVAPAAPAAQEDLDEPQELREPAGTRTWEFHDLLFHMRSRVGRHDYPIGGTYRFAGQREPEPAVAPRPVGSVRPLYRPDYERLLREDRPFTWVQEARRSIREYGRRALADRELGEFLFRVGRVSDYWSGAVPTPRGPARMEFAPRPYPAGGALYELELYVVINRCEGLARGLYAYDPEAHGLRQLPARDADVWRLLTDAGRSTRIAPEHLQVLIVVTSRFPRVAWKYASMAYALTLKHVGILYSTMYLVATAMDLAPCGVGCGDSDAFARAAGTDYYTETSVGEFLLGARS